jgi:hypothetical protein
LTVFVSSLTRVASDKGSRGGFAVGGFTSRKGDGFEYLHIDHGQIEATIDDLLSGKGSRGGFAVGGFSTRKTVPGTDFFSITPGNSLFNLDIDYTTDERVRAEALPSGAFHLSKKAIISPVSWMHLMEGSL